MRKKEKKIETTKNKYSKLTKDQILKKLDEVSDKEIKSLDGFIKILDDESLLLHALVEKVKKEKPQ